MDFAALGVMASRRKSHWAEDLVLAPWWVSLMLALVVPMVLAAFPPTVFVAPIGFILLLSIAAISALRSVKTKRMLDGQTSLESIRELSWKRFEDLLGEAYRRQGYKVEESLGSGADGGVDLVLRRDGATIIVQCKRWVNRPVPVQIVRELYGVMHDQHATEAKLITTSSFTSEARAFAVGKSIEMVGGKELVTLIRSVQGSVILADGSTECRPTVEDGGEDHRPTVECPRCGAEMIKRTAKRGANVRIGVLRLFELSKDGMPRDTSGF